MESGYGVDEVRLDGWKQMNDSEGCAKERRAVMHMLLIEFHAAIFALPCVLSDGPPVLWWLSPGEGWVAIA